MPYNFFLEGIGGGCGHPGHATDEYSSIRVHLTASLSITVAPDSSNHFSVFTMIHSVTQFYVQIILILVLNLFLSFPGPTSLSGSLKLHSNKFSLSHRRPLSVFLCTVPYRQTVTWSECSAGGRPPHYAPAPCKLTFDRLTLKVVSESLMTWATSVPLFWSS